MDLDDPSILSSRKSRGRSRSLSTEKFAVHCLMLIRLNEIDSAIAASLIKEQEEELDNGEKITCDQLPDVGIAKSNEYHLECNLAGTKEEIYVEWLLQYSCHSA